MSQLSLQDLLSGFPRQRLQPFGREELVVLFGVPAWRPAGTRDDPAGILVPDTWERENLVRVEVPELAGVLGGHGERCSGHVLFHHAVAEQLRRLFRAWKAAGLMPQVLTFDGAFETPLHRGRPGRHAHGVAFDVNAPWNPPGGPPALPDEIGTVFELVDVAQDFGFIWGGHLAGRVSGGHFEVAELL